MDTANLPPPDKLNLIYLTFLLNGIGVLTPWNMFINADTYFTEYKFAKDQIGFTFPYLSSFLQYLTFCSQVPNVSFNWVNIFVKIGGNLTTRIVWSIVVQILVFIATVILAMLNSKEWPYAFFYITMICVVILNTANAIYQNTVFGMAAKLPPKYTGAVVLGTNISGAFTSVVSILSKIFTSNKRMAAIYYFITALLVLLLCFDTYFALPLNKFYRHHELKEKKIAEDRTQRNSGKIVKIPYFRVFKQALPQLYNAFCVLFVTLAVFPSINASIKPVNTTFLGQYFSDVTCFLTFNTTAMLGSLLTSFICWPSPKYLWIPITLRVLYIPFYIFCNYEPEGTERILPVIITNDWIYWITSITLGLSSGYLCSLAMMYVPSTVEEAYAGTAGMFGAACMITGVFVGILLSFAWPGLVS